MAVWLYYRFTLSLRDLEDLLAERGIDVSYESVRYWANKFGDRGQHSPGEGEGRYRLASR